MGTHRPRLPEGGRLIPAPDILTDGLEARLHGLARGARREFRIVAPFIKAPQVEAALACVPPSVRATVTTRWVPEEVASGVSDLEVLDVCRAAGAELRLLDRLHAKLFVADGRKALVGSANLTARGLGSAVSPNLELLLPCEPSPRSIETTLCRMDLESRPATDEERASVAALAAEVAHAAAAAPPRRSSELVVRAAWLPEFRSPDRLFSVYHDLSRGVLDGTEPVALRDIVALGLGFDMDRPSFERAVRASLAAMPAIVDLDGFLRRSRRFGEVTGWLEAWRPSSTRIERQRAGQTLIRWLTHFDPERYRVSTPRFSEVLSLAEPRSVGKD